MKKLLVIATIVMSTATAQDAWNNVANGVDSYFRAQKEREQREAYEEQQRKMERQQEEQLRMQRESLNLQRQMLYQQQWNNN